MGVSVQRQSTHPMLFWAMHAGWVRNKSALLWIASVVDSVFTMGFDFKTCFIKTKKHELQLVFYSTL